MSQLTTANPKATCIATLVVVFMFGGVVGASVMSITGHTRLHKSAFWTAPGKEASLQKLRRDLDLTPTQTEELNTILDDFSKYYSTVLSDGKSRIFQILDENQKRKFEKILAETQRP